MSGDHRSFLAKIFLAMMIFTGLVWVWTVAFIISWPWEKSNVWKPEFRVVAVCANNEPCGVAYRDLAEAKAKGLVDRLVPWTGVTRALAFTERAGQHLWRQIPPLTRRFLPAKPVLQALGPALLSTTILVGLSFVLSLAIALPAGVASLSVVADGGGLHGRDVFGQGSGVEPAGAPEP